MREKYTNTLKEIEKFFTSTNMNYNEYAFLPYLDNSEILEKSLN